MRVRLVNQQNTLAEPPASDASVAQVVTALQEVKTLLETSPMSVTKVYLNANQSVPSGVVTIAQFNVVMWDRNAEWSNYKFTAKSAGWYSVTAAVRFDVAANNEANLQLYKNGNLVATDVKKDAAECRYLHISTDVYLELGQTVDARVYQATGVNKTLVGNEYVTWFAIHKVAE